MSQRGSVVTAELGDGERRWGEGEADVGVGEFGAKPPACGMDQLDVVECHAWKAVELMPGGVAGHTGIEMPRNQPEIAGREDPTTGVAVRIATGLELLEVGQLSYVDLLGQLATDGSVEVFIRAKLATWQRPGFGVGRHGSLPEQHGELAVPNLEHHGEDFVPRVAEFIRHCRHAKLPGTVFDLKAKTWEAGLAVQMGAAGPHVEDRAIDDAGQPGTGVALPAGWPDEVRALARQRDAVILAHNYQRPEIQDVADHVGDSLALSRIAARSEASTIVFCGVHFMAETAKILSPDKTVLIPDPAAGCSLSDTITAEQLREWKAEHPGAVVVAYVNTSAAVKAESDVCCTSSNAADVIRSIPPDREVLFLPDQFLGAHVQRETGRENMHIWMGECHVHAGIDGATLRSRIEADPDAEVLVHPECGCATSALYLVGAGAVPSERVRILSTGGMLEAARETESKRVLVATETGMLHQLRSANPGTDFNPVNDRAVCRYMKMITAEKLLRSLRAGVVEVDVPGEVSVRARTAVERMVAIGNPSRGGE